MPSTVIRSLHYRPETRELEVLFTTGRAYVFHDVPPDVYRGFGFPGADDMGNMFQFKRDFNDYYVKSRSVEMARELNPELQSFNEWLATHAPAGKRRKRHRR